MGPYACGIVVMVILWLTCRVLVGSWNPWKLVIGADGKPSTSKLQWFLWTIVIIFAYTVIFAARVEKGIYESVSEIPANLLIAMGFSIATMAVSKGVTVAYLASGRITKSKAVKGAAAGPGSIIQDDDGFPDLSKIQMLAWTVIAIGTFMVHVAYQVNSAFPQLPDIDASIMVLMGLGQGAYLGKRLTTTSVPRLAGLSPGSGKPGSHITLTGFSFDGAAGNLVTLDGSPANFDREPGWEDGKITFTLPAKQPGGEDWLAGQRVSVGLIVNGQESANKMPFTVTL